MPKIIQMKLSLTICKNKNGAVLWLTVYKATDHWDGQLRAGESWRGHLAKKKQETHQEMR